MAREERHRGGTSGRVVGSSPAGKETARSALVLLQELSTTKRREGMQRYFTTEMHCVGVTTADLRKITRETLEKLKQEPKPVVLECAQTLLESGTLEARQLAYEIVSRHPGTMQDLSVDDIEELGTGNDNWASVDAFSVLITGALWLRGRIEDRTVVDWARSPDPWWRRTALVSLIPHNLKSRGGTGDTRRTLMIVDLLKGDRHPAVVKAISWALRSLVAWDAEAVRRYVEENAAALPALARREVRNKLETGVKNPK